MIKKLLIKLIFKFFALFEDKTLRFCIRWIKLYKNKPYADAIFMQHGILPVEDHYYQPLINPKKHLRKPLNAVRNLPALDLNIKGQLDLLEKFNFADELLQFPLEKEKEISFYYKNQWYESGDAEYLYSMIRFFKPKNIIEVGSGFSTIMTVEAIKKNKQEDSAYECKLTCVEPYEQPWLDNSGLNVVREKIEHLDSSLFQVLRKNDILFIDSSHIIRAQGDVLYEFLELIPNLNPGVFIHVHDIFTPRDYPKEWLVDNHLLWNEQYLLEAFLSFNNDFTVIGALNLLAHDYPKQFASACPNFQFGNEPKAFWFKRNE